MTRQTDAQRDMALVADLLRGAPGDRGVEFWVVVARNICAKHGVHSLMGQRDADDAQDLGLTAQQAQTLVLLADGATARTLAASLGITVDSARVRIRSLCRRLGARTPAQAVALAARAHLI